MRFHKSDNEIVDLLDQEELEKAQLKIIKESKAFKEHSQKHEGANLNIEKTEQEIENKITKDEREKIFGNQDIYQKEAQHVTASCTCGMRFEIVENNVYSRNEVKPGKTETYGNKNSEGESSTYTSSFPSPSYKK